MYPPQSFVTDPAYMNQPHLGQVHRPMHPAYNPGFDPKAYHNPDDVFSQPMDPFTPFQSVGNWSIPVAGPYRWAQPPPFQQQPQPAQPFGNLPRYNPAMTSNTFNYSPTPFSLPSINYEQSMYVEKLVASAVNPALVNNSLYGLPGFIDNIPQNNLPSDFSNDFYNVPPGMVPPGMVLPPVNNVVETRTQPVVEEQTIEPPPSLTPVTNSPPPQIPETISEPANLTQNVTVTPQPPQAVAVPNGNSTSKGTNNTSGPRNNNKTNVPGSKAVAQKSTTNGNQKTTKNAGPKNNPPKNVPVKETKEEAPVVQPPPEPVANSAPKPFSWADVARSQAAAKKEAVEPAPAVAQKAVTPAVSNDTPQEQEQGQKESSHSQSGKPRRRGKGPIPNLECLADINSASFQCKPKFAKFFVIKSYSEDDVHKSIKYSIWTSTDTGNKRLDKAYRECASKGPIYLFFSVNSSGQFCGIAEMTSPLDFAKTSECWNEDKWNGQFAVKWRFIKDIPNSQLRHIRLSNNENKPVTNSRDTQEVLHQPGCELLKTFSTYNSKSSILDDFSFYNEAEEKEKKNKENAKKEKEAQAQQAANNSS